MKKLVELECKSCGNSFIGIPERKYCSYTCSHKSREKKKTLICLNCKKEYIVQDYRDSKFCSVECKTEYQTGLEIIKKCDYCEKEFSRKEFKCRGKHCFCSKKCSELYLVGEDHYEYKEFLHDKNLKTALKQWAKLIKERDNFTCQKCGEDRKYLLEAHHLNTRCLHPELQFEIDNGITLCLKCHRLEHLDNQKILNLIDSKIKKYYKDEN